MLLSKLTSEIERKDSALITTKKKCLIAMKYSSCDFAIASEGSFGMHPSLSYIETDMRAMYNAKGRSSSKSM